MVKRVIEIPFSLKGIDRLNAILKTMSGKTVQLEKLFQKRSIDYLEKRANYYISITTGGSSWYQVTGKLSRSWIKDYDLGTLINYCGYSAFVEYGTGVAGKGTHPDAQGYQYDVNGHGSFGWGFIDDDGNIHWTNGMKAHRFLFDAVQDYVIGKEYVRIFNKCFEEIVGGILK